MFAGSKDEPVESAASKPWLNEALPYLSKESGNDVCFMKDGTLCVLYVLKGASDKYVEGMLKNVNDNFVAGLSTSIRFTFARLDTEKEAALAEAFNLESAPALVILNAGKRKRFLVHEGDMTAASLQHTL